MDHDCFRAVQMCSDTDKVRRLYTEKLNAYERFIAFFRSQDAVKALLERSGLLRPKLRILDAGSGFGTVTFALLNALGQRSMQPESIEADSRQVDVLSHWSRSASLTIGRQYSPKLFLDGMSLPRAFTTCIARFAAPGLQIADPTAMHRIEGLDSTKVARRSARRRRFLTS